MSLVSTLMSGVTESALDLGAFNYSAEASMESYWADAACESLVTDIYNVDKAYLTADVIGEVKTLTEGADPSVLLEGMISSGIEKLKEAFKKFLAKIKEWAAKVKKFFKIIFLKGKDFVKEFGSEIRKKKTKGFIYSSFDYDPEAGDALVEKISGDVSKEIDTLLNVTEGSTRDGVSDEDIAALLARAVGGTENSPKTASEYQDSLCKNSACKASDVSEMLDKIEETYKNGDDTKSDIEDFGGKNDPSDMLSFIDGFDKKIKDVERAENDFEKDINAIIKAFDKASATSKKDREGIKDANGKVMGDAAYKAASKVSSYLSSALTVRKSAVDKQVSMNKEINGAFTSILKSFLRWKPTKESYDFSGADEIIMLTEAADAVDVEVPEEEAPAEGSTDGKDTVKEGASLFETAYQYL